MGGSLIKKNAPSFGALGVIIEPVSVRLTTTNAPSQDK
jgi:hypothetical protein